MDQTSKSRKMPIAARQLATHIRPVGAKDHTVETKHDAFISYNHRADHKLAKALEDGMEKLAKPLLALRAIDVFRDETGLAANPDLWAGIVGHLTGTRWLVLLVCPEWASSLWCSREALWWMEHRSTDRMLIAVIGGEL